MQKEELPVNLAAPRNLTLMNRPATLSLAFAAATDTGCKRANNQDSFGYNTESASLRRVRMAWAAR